MKQYNLYLTQDEDYDIFPYKSNNKMIEILNAFNHFLFCHNNNDDFVDIYKAFGGKCKLSKCIIMERYANYHKNNDDNKLFALKILNELHCYFIHSYDMGFRLTGNELQQINFADEQKQSQHEIMKSKLRKLTKILSTKTNPNYRRMCEIGNRYSSNMNQIKKTMQNIENKIPSYSYSYNFNYWQHCEYSTNYDNGDSAVCDLYVAPKYKCLKDEVLQNKIQTINIGDWVEIMNKTHVHQLTLYGASIYAQINQYVPHLNFMDTHPSKYGYIDGEPIRSQNICSIMIYTDFDEFQAKFSETYRALTENETFNTIKTRHSEYHHFAKTLKETVEIFGVEYQDGNVRTMYHGINQEMIFTSIFPEIYSVLSTTSVWTVGVQFSNNQGLVLELVPNPRLKYFDCCWLSAFPSESELLFVGGWGRMNFVNIVNTLNGVEYKQYIYALRIIDVMSECGQYFNADCTIIHTIKHKKTWNLFEIFNIKNDNIEELKRLDIPQHIKQLTKQLIEHELSRNGYRTNKFKQIKDLHPYIAKLSHEICQNKTIAHFNWKAIKLNVVKYFDGEEGGYIGYSFLSPYFCTDNYKGINLELIIALFPYLQQFQIRNITLINITQFLMDILEFLKQYKHERIKCFVLSINKELGVSNLTQQCNNYKSHFESIGWNMYVYKDEYLGTNSLFIHKYSANLS